jgi:hypothetical protein
MFQAVLLIRGVHPSRINLLILRETHAIMPRNIVRIGVDGKHKQP